MSALVALLFYKPCVNVRELSAPCVKMAQDVNASKTRPADAVAVGAKSMHQQCWRKCRCVIEMADKTVCFALGVGVVKGDQSAAVFRSYSGEEGRSIPSWPAANALTRPSTRYIILH